MDTNEFEPAFSFDTSESSVLLNQGEAEMHIDGNTYKGTGEARLDLLPNGRLHIYGRFQGVPDADRLKTIADPKTISCFSINSRQVDGFAVNIRVEEPAKEMTVKWLPRSEPIIGIGDETTQMSRVVFHLFNFVEYFGTRRSFEQNGAEMRSIEHIDLIYGGWKVELKSLFVTKDNFDKLKAEGGYCLTHIGSIEKAAGTSFSATDVSNCLNGLRFFLSFAKGGWCEPVCAVGYDASGTCVWECWSSPKELWQAPLSWFDPHNSSQLTMLFPDFMTRWTSVEWREALHEIIYWYLNANHSSRGIDAGIVLAQAAIERLSYEFAVNDRRLLTSNGFKDLWASDKFRLLFSSLNIPLSIPTETPELRNLAKKGQMNWLDAPHALTEIRNSLVHPEHKQRRQLGKAYYEAWNLSLWYLEISILAICGYSGTYGNRLRLRWVGQVEDVPWKK